MGKFGSSVSVNATQLWRGTSVNQTKFATALTTAGLQLQRGNNGSGGGCTGCEPNVPFVTTLLEFVSILESLKSSIDKYFPSIGVGMAIGGMVSAHGTMDVRLFARLEWIRRYRDTKGKFDVTSEDHIYLLKDIFQSLGADWRMDKWLSDWTPTPPPAAGGSTVTGAPGSATRSEVA